jgi:hypothetical protein
LDQVRVLSLSQVRPHGMTGGADAWRQHASAPRAASRRAHGALRASRRQKARNADGMHASALAGTRTGS